MIIWSLLMGIPLKQWLYWDSSLLIHHGVLVRSRREVVAIDPDWMINDHMGGSINGGSPIAGWFRGTSILGNPGRVKNIKEKQRPGYIPNRSEQLFVYGGFLRWGTPKSSIFMWFSIISHPAIGGPPFMETPILMIKWDRDDDHTIVNNWWGYN